MKSIIKNLFKIAIFTILGTTSLAYAGPKISWFNYFQINGNPYQVHVFATCDNGGNYWDKYINPNKAWEYQPMDGCKDAADTITITLTAIKEGGGELLKKTFVEKYQRYYTYQYFDAFIDGSTDSSGQPQFKLDFRLEPSGDSKKLKSATN